MKKFFVSFFVLVVIASSATVFADDFSMFTPSVPEQPKDFAAFVCIVIKLALDFIPYLVVIAVGAFIQGLIKYVGHGDNEEKMSEGRKMMIYGIFGFFMMVSVWGILGIFTNSFGLSVVIPQFKSDKSFDGVCD
jgi:hypothetical protein